MGRLLHFEFRKLLRMKSFYICAAILAALLLLVVATFSYTKSNTEAQIKAEAGDAYFYVEDMSEVNFDMNDFVVGAVSGVQVCIFLAVVISLFVCMDYSCGAIKNVIAKGYSRMRVCLSKYIVAMLIGALYTVFTMVIGGLFGGMFFGFDTKMTSDGLLQSLVQVLIICAYCAGFFLLSVLVKKSGGAIAAAILTPQVVSILTTFIDSYINSETFKITNYTLSGCLTLMSDAAGVTSTVLTRSAVCAAVYFAVFTLFAFVVSKRAEV